MADRIAVMSQGRIEQVASPTDIYDRPQTLFVNQFVGTTNVLHGDVAAGAQVTVAGGARLDIAPPPGLAPGSRIVVCIRPEHLCFEAAGAQTGLPGTIKAVMPLGADDAR